MTTSIALFDCPHCIDELACDHQKIVRLAYGWRVRVRCPGCGNIVEVVMVRPGDMGYTMYLRHG